MGQGTNISKIDTLNFDSSAELVGLFVELDKTNSFLKTLGAYVDTCSQTQEKSN